MKKITVLLTMAFVLSLFLPGCGKSPSTSKKRPKPNYNNSTTTSSRTESTKKTVKKKTVKKKTETKKKSASSGDSFSESANSLINYGTGGTHLKIKKKKKDQLNKIQEMHNKRINDALK